MSLFYEVYLDNKTYSLKHNKPVSARVAHNMAIDHYRHHDKRTIELTENRYYTNDDSWKQIEFRDLIEVLVDKIVEDNNEEELKILITLLKIYQLDCYAGTDLFEWYDWYNALTIPEEILQDATRSTSVPKTVVARLCELLPVDTYYNSSYNKHLSSLKKRIEKLGLTIYDLFGDNASVAFTPIKSSPDFCHSNTTPMKPITEKNALLILKSSSHSVA